MRTAIERGLAACELDPRFVAIGLGSLPNADGVLELDAAMMDGADLSTPALRWGVDTGLDGILFCGSGAQRGGAVSAIGGHHAAMAVLESR